MESTHDKVTTNQQLESWHNFTYKVHLKRESRWQIQEQFGEEEEGEKRL